MNKASKINSPEEIKTLFSWESFSRPFKKQDKEYFTTILSMVFLISVILFFIKEWLLIGVILSVTFVVYVLGTVAPEKVGHKITTHGVTTGGKSYLWKELTDFSFTTKYNESLLAINSKLRFPGRLLIIINPNENNRIKKILSEYLPFREISEISFLDKAATWLSQKMPIAKSKA